MDRSQLRVGQIVYFGRQDGEKTKAKIVKLNPKNAKVQTLERRGHGRGSDVGATWNVPYALLTSAGEHGEPIPQPKLEYSPFMDPVEYCILEAISVAYSCLSPENLTGDGELPRTIVNQRYNKYNTALMHLFNAYGRKVSETEIFDWMREKREAERQHQNA